MTSKQIKKSELAKIEILEQIVKLLEQLEKTADSDAVDWVIEKINE